MLSDMKLANTLDPKKISAAVLRICDRKLSISSSCLFQGETEEEKQARRALKKSKKDAKRSNQGSQEASHL